MRDGVRLSANVFLPSETARVPAILVRTPYGKGPDITPHYQAFVERGYAVVVQDVRGRYESEGAFLPLTQEPLDGDDTLNWIARQPWSDGKIGMMGGSYSGIVQWKAALRNNPHLKAIFPVVSGYDDYRDRYYSTGGALKLGNRLGWMSENMRAGYHQDFGKFILHLPVRSSDVPRSAGPRLCSATSSTTPRSIPSGARHQHQGASGQGQGAGLQCGGWYDNFVQATWKPTPPGSNRLSRVLMVPGRTTCPCPSKAFLSEQSAVPIRALQMQWFDQFLMGKDVPLLSSRRSKIFVMGANSGGRNRWPPNRRGPKSSIWRAAAKATPSDDLDDAPPRVTASDHLSSTLHTPCRRTGRQICPAPKSSLGTLDQRASTTQGRPTSLPPKPLKRSEVIGPVQTVLYVASSARDTDFTANGGRLPRRHSADPDRRHPAPPLSQFAQPSSPSGEVYRGRRCGRHQQCLPEGHRIRIEISSNFPRFDRNANTGGPVERLPRSSRSLTNHLSRSLLRVVLSDVARNAAGRSRQAVTEPLLPGCRSSIAMARVNCGGACAASPGRNAPAQRFHPRKRALYASGVVQPGARQRGIPTEVPAQKAASAK
jgi:putative CocE/NonD family hydrolase